MNAKAQKPNLRSEKIQSAIFVPVPSGSAIEMVTIDPLDLEAALERDAANPPPANELGERSRAIDQADGRCCRADQGARSA